MIKKIINDMEKINLLELLKDCPKGMELDCAMFENVSFRGIQNGTSQIMIHTPDGIQFLNSFGCYHDSYRAKCVIFPKGKTTWEGFVPPCNFKDGDIIYNRLQKRICICHYREDGTIYITHCRYNICHKEFELLVNDLVIVKQDYRLATEEEKQKLFDAIKAHGYKWNEETKTLEKLIIPKFKVGDIIKNKNSGICNKVIKISEDCYLVESCLYERATIGFDIQDNWELVPQKFDINTLKPFDKVLVRDNNEQLWTVDLFGFHGKTPYSFMCVGHYTNQCVPYEGNEHLLGTNDKCNEFYKTWE